LAGSMGIFGALVELSIKVAPTPSHERTLVLDVSEAQALEWFGKWRGLPIPITATAWMASQDDTGGRLHVRVSGSEPAVLSGAGKIGGHTMPATEADAFWTSLRDQTHPFFQARPLWRVAVPPQTPPLQAGPTLIEWNGGLRWVAAVASASQLRDDVAHRGGHATVYRFDHKQADVPVFHPLQPGLKNQNRRLKQELDSVGIFNPKRLYPDL